MVYLVFFVLAVAFYASVIVRIVVLHPVGVVRHTLVDFYHYIRYHNWRLCRAGGKIIAFVGLFGKGKTLSAVKYVTDIYRKYNDKRVYDIHRKKWVTQKILILSNVDLASVPYEKFTGLGQLVSIADSIREIDDKNDTRTVTIALGDEFSVQLNSRSFKTNIDPLFLNTLLTCRHHGGGISLVYTSQRFQHCDKLLRDVTGAVISCEKLWRFMVHKYYDAFDLENATTTSLVRPYKRTGYLVLDKHFQAYDTLAVVDNLKKSVESGDMLSEAEIIHLQNPAASDLDVVSRPNRRARKLQKGS